MTLAAFVEPIPHIFAKLQKTLTQYPGYVGIQALCSDVANEWVDFFVSSNDGGSSSMLGLGNHASLYPSISYVETLHLQTSTADNIAKSHFPGTDFDLLVLDTQGAEMHVLRGAVDLLQRSKAAWIEVSEEPLYEGGCTFEEVTAFTRSFGMKLRQVSIGKEGWGDALYVKK